MLVFERFVSITNTFHRDPRYSIRIACYPRHKVYKAEKDGETVWDIAALCRKATAEKNNISELPAQQNNTEETPAA